MYIDDIKNEIEIQTGVPASLLTGETAEENIAQAKALLAYKKEYAAKAGTQEPQEVETRFKNWVEKQFTIKKLL